METGRAKSGYETLRNARLLENQARLASLGLHTTISQLRQYPAASAEAKPKRPAKQTVYELTPSRRSQRINRTDLTVNRSHLPPRRSQRLRRSKTDLLSPKEEKVEVSVEEEESLPSGSEKTRPANAPLIKLKGGHLELSAVASAVRCNSKGRGSIYNPVFGICCHFCRACLKVRYGEELEEVRENKQWMCPHCIEAKGINPYWICNSSICLKKSNIAPTGIAIFRAREMGYESVAHFLMDELKVRDTKKYRT